MTVCPTEFSMTSTTYYLDALCHKFSSEIMTTTMAVCTPRPVKLASMFDSLIFLRLLDSSELFLKQPNYLFVTVTTTITQGYAFLFTVY